MPKNRPLLSGFTSGFVGVGDVFAKTLKSPSQKPVHTNTFSFDFSRAADFLKKPFREVFDPERGASKKIFQTLADEASDIIRAGGDRIERMLRKGTEEPAQVIVKTPTVENPFPLQASGPLSLSEFFKNVLGRQSTNPRVEINKERLIPDPDEKSDEIIIQSAEHAKNQTLIFGALAVGALFLFTRRR